MELGLSLAPTGQQLLALLICEGEFIGNPIYRLRDLYLTRIGKAKDGKHQGLEIWNRHITTRSNYLAPDYCSAMPRALGSGPINRIHISSEL